ncbi:MAG: hypothetical protein OQK51_06325 [Kangiellaceae bacterium]|nr:hypothetical protein [Kangiellaceae bacterium]
MSVVRLRPLSLICCVLLVSACQNGSDQTSQSTTELTNSSTLSTKIPVACKQPAPIEDIWKLEPILVAKGTITTEMSQGEKEVAIKEYIAKKNAQYKLCLKGGKK